MQTPAWTFVDRLHSGLGRILRTSAKYPAAPAADTPLLDRYYAGRAVRQRMVDYLGGPSLGHATAMYVQPSDFTGFSRSAKRAPTDLWRCVSEEGDVARSLWARDSLIAHLDIEYVNFDFPGEAYLNPRRAFELQRPVRDITLGVLRRWGIQPLHVLSGRGHHFVWSIAGGSRAFGRLAELGSLPASLRDSYSKPREPSGRPVGVQLGAAFAGLGQVVEYLGHCIIREAAAASELPIALTATEVGPSRCGRELVSIDISEYADPLHTRSIRIPFSAYLKPQHQRDLVGDHVVSALPPLFAIPAAGLASHEALDIMRNADRTSELATSARTHIPDASKGMKRLIDAYEASRLARFHSAFNAESRELAAWLRSYLDDQQLRLPACVRLLLQRPNDLLLRPAGIQSLVRVLLARGWQAQHIAGLLRSTYQQDPGWGHTFQRYDACMRADFYVRIFAGLIHAGLDGLVDFNCRSTQEKGYCPGSHCDDNLLAYKGLLIDRVRA